MHLLSLTTVNFKRLGNFTCNFTKGLNVIAGDNARGKSTLLQAIEAALFGITVVPGKKEGIPTWGQTKASIELNFIVKAATYQVVRTLTTAKLMRGDEIVANGNSPVTAAIEELLGLTSKDWNLFIQSKQHEASGILTFGATALNRKVEEFAGVELIEKVQAEAQRRYGLYSSYAEAKGVPLEELDTLAGELMTAQANHKAAENSLASAKEAAEQLPPFNLELPALRSQEARNMQRDVDRLSNAVDLAASKLEAAQRAVADATQRAEAVTLQDGEALTEDLAQLKADGELTRTEVTALRAKQELHTSAQTAFTRAEAMFDGTHDEFQSKFREFDEQVLRDELDQNDSVSATLRDSISSESEVVGKAKAAYDNLVSLADGAVCPTCNRAKDDHDPEKLKEESHAALLNWEEAKKHVAKLRDDLQVVLDRRLKIVGDLADFDRAAKKVDETSAGLASAKEHLAANPSVAEVLKEVEEAYEKLRTDYAAKQQQLKGVEENNERHAAEHRALAKAESELEICNDTLKDAEKALEDAPEPPTDEEITAIEAQEKAYLDARTAWEQKSSQLTGELRNAAQAEVHQKEMQAVAQRRMDEANRKIEESKADSALAKKYSRLVQFLRDRRQAYLAEIWNTVMGIATRLVRQSSQNTITQVDNNDGDFFYEEEGNMTPSASASGAQKAMIGTSMRVALGRALYGGDSLMIFDEPTESCKEHNAASMAATLATSAKQVLLITHRETDQGLAENIINVGE